MSYNKSLFMQMRKESKQKKTQPKPKDRIVDPMGQWKYPGEVTRIPSNRITMQGVPYPVLGVGSNGQRQMMFPGQEYTFPGSQYVDEYPMMKAQNGGTSNPQERAKKAKDFLTNMYNSPLFAKRYAAMTGRRLRNINPKEIEEYRNTLLNNLNTVYAAPFGEEPKKGEFYTGDDMSFPNLIGGVYYENPPEEGKPGHSVWLNKYFADQPTTTHEWSHASTKAKKNLPFTHKIPFNYDASLAGYAQEQFANENKKTYLTDPTEIKGRKDAVAQFLQEQGVWDPTKKRFGKKQYNYLKNLEKEVEDKLNNELPVDDKLLEVLSQWQDISLPYRKKDTRRIFNEIVKSNNNNYLTFAQSGGPIVVPYSKEYTDKEYQDYTKFYEDYFRPPYLRKDDRYDAYYSEKLKGVPSIPEYHTGWVKEFSGGDKQYVTKQPKTSTNYTVRKAENEIIGYNKDPMKTSEVARLTKEFVNYKPTSLFGFKNGGDISIPNLEKGNWLNKYQRGGPTRSDSLALYNNAKAIEQYYKNKNYSIIPNDPTINFSPNNYLSILKDVRRHYGVKQDEGLPIREDDEELKKWANIYYQLDPKGAYTWKNPETGKIYRISKTPSFNWRYSNLIKHLQEYYQPIDKNKFKQRELSHGFLDKNSPMPLYDRRITPQSVKTYVNNPNNITDRVEMVQYDLLAVAPWDILNPKQQKERLKKYGTKGTPYDLNIPKKNIPKKNIPEKNLKPADKTQELKTVINKQPVKSFLNFSVPLITKQPTIKPNESGDYVLRFNEWNPQTEAYVPKERYFKTREEADKTMEFLKDENDRLYSSGAFGSRLYYDKLSTQGNYKDGGQFNFLNRYQGGGSFPSLGKIIQNTKKSLNTWLGDPYEKAHQFAEIFGGPDNDEIDNARHAMAGNLTAQGIQNKFPNWMKYTGVPQLTGFLGSNVLGMGHEFSTLFDPKDKRSFLVKMRELGEDGVNNFVGSVIGSTSLSSSEKQKWIEYLSANNLLPDGYGEADANMYFKKQTGGSISLNKEYFPGKGWAYILPEVVIKSKKIKNNQYNIPIDNTQVASNLSAIQELKELEQFQKQNPHLSPFALMTLFRNQRASKQYLNQDYRTDYERQQAIKKIQAENNYREKVLGISKGTTQVERDKNRKKNEKLLNALEVAMAAEGGFSLLKPSISKVTTNLVQNTTSPNALRSIINPLGIVDEVAPMLPNPIKLLTFGAPVGNTGPMTLSPLNLIPGYGKVLGRPGTAYRKFGNTMDHVITTKTLSPKGGSPLRLGKNQITNEGNWAELDAPNENYPGVFAAEFDFNNPGTNLGYVNPSNRNGVLITTNTGKKLVDIPIKDQGVDFYRRLPFSNRYMPIDKQKILNNEFQWATQGGYLQSLAEKYGMAYVYASGLAAMGNKKPLELLQKYTLDPKTFKENLKEMGLTEQYKKGGQTNWLDAYDDSEQLQQFDPGGTTRFATTFTTTSKSTANQQLQYLNYWANQSKSNNQNGSILNRPQQTSTGIMTTDDLYRAAGINFNQKPQVVIQPGYVAGNTTKEGAIQINKVHKVSQPGMTYQQKVNQVKANDQKKKDDERRAKEEQERQIKEREAAAATRAKVIGGNNNAIFTFPDGTTKAWKDMDWREQAYVSGKNLGSWNNNNWTDWINPLAMLGSLSEGIGTSPYVARKTNSYMPYITGFGIPLLTGALAGIGTNTTSQFANNLVNPFAGLENVAQQYLNKGKQLFRNTSSKPIIQTADEFPEKLELQLSDEDFARMNREIDEAMADPKNKEAFDDIQGTLDNAEMTAEEYKQKLRDDQARQYSYDLDNYNTYYKRGYGDMVEDKFITEDYVKNFNKNFRNDLSAQRKYIGKTKKEIIDDFIEQTEKLGKNPNDVDPDGFIRGLMGYPGFTPIDWKPSPLGFQIYDPESMMQSQKQISNWPINLGGREIKPNENFIRVYDKSKGMVDWPNILQKGFYIKNKKGGEVNWLNKYT